MRLPRILSGVLFVGLAVCAGIGLDLFQRASIVHGAPPSTLTSVAHDTTLTGAGTTASPLGVAGTGIGTAQIANGAVTLPKLSITGTAAVGKVVGFSGSGLAWQTPATSGTGGVQVVDGVGHSFPVGIMTFLSPVQGASWQTAGRTFIIPLSTNGVTDYVYQILYATGDCSGPAYLYDPLAYKLDPATLLIQVPGVTFATFNSTLYYVTGSTQQIIMNSYRGTGNLGETLTCNTNISTDPLPVNSTVTVNLTSAFVAPFHIVLN